MKDLDDLERMLAALSRWRHSCILYFKFDLALIAAIAAMVSFFNLHGTDLVASAYQYKQTLYYLFALIIYACLYELCITSTSNRSDLAQLVVKARHRTLIYRACSLGYAVQVLAHIWLLVGAFGFAAGYVDGFMSACHMVAGKCAGT